LRSPVPSAQELPRFRRGDDHDPSSCRREGDGRGFGTKPTIPRRASPTRRLGVRAAGGRAGVRRRPEADSQLAPVRQRRRVGETKLHVLWTRRSAATSADRQCVPEGWPRRAYYPSRVYNVTVTATEKAVASRRSGRRLSLAGVPPMALAGGAVVKVASARRGSAVEVLGRGTGRSRPTTPPPCGWDASPVT